MGRKAKEMNWEIPQSYLKNKYFHVYKPYYITETGTIIDLNVNSDVFFIEPKYAFQFIINEQKWTSPKDIIGKIITICDFKIPRERIDISVHLLNIDAESINLNLSSLADEGTNYGLDSVKDYEINEIELDVQKEKIWVKNIDVSQIKGK
jgi:hypothetical protein